MDSPVRDVRAEKKNLEDLVPTVGLLVANVADRRLLVDFLETSGYGVRPGTLPAWEELSLIIVDESAAREYGNELVLLKRQSGAVFLPLLVALPAQSESTPWLRAGFDDVLRMPLRKAELAARLEVYLQLRKQIQDVTARKQSEAQLRQTKTELETRVAERTQELSQANAELHRLTQRVVLAQEEERQRLSRELHDEIGQALTAVTFNLLAIRRLVSDPKIASRLEDSLKSIESTLHQVRDLSLDLHPPVLDYLGLVAALQWYFDRQAKRAGLTIELAADSVERDLPADVKTTCFRISQEAITNILRHAQAKTVRVELRQRDASLELVIRDDGIGFDVVAARRLAAQGASLGLLGMEERVLLLRGRFKIKSGAGKGTEVRARFPLPAAPVGKSRGRSLKSKGTE